MHGAPIIAMIIATATSNSTTFQSWSDRIPDMSIWRQVLAYKNVWHSEN